MKYKKTELKKIFRLSFDSMGKDTWDALSSLFLSCTEQDEIVNTIRSVSGLDIPDYVRDLACLEFAYYNISNKKIKMPEKIDRFELNPVFDLLELSWNVIPIFFAGKFSDYEPEKEENFGMIWKDIHCYDRNNRTALDFDKSMNVLWNLREFCKLKFVKGHVCFTGGNPFLHPQFFDMYKAAKDHGFSTSLLGNPVSADEIKKLIRIQKPAYIQVSLEGLPEYNDYIRGKGHFKKAIKFLDLLRDFDISSSVMLTLNKDNINQVIPLAEILKNHTDYFTFNRLSQVGEGKNLLLPAKEEFVSFLGKYIDASRKNTIIGYKDNLINIELYKRGMKLFGGCTGYGCGAAFNFITILPDGEVHACRKFPSSIGNINKQTISEIYESNDAKKYRKGCNECDNCEIRAVCGGCLAVSYSSSLDIEKEKDPFCFL